MKIGIAGYGFVGKVHSEVLRNWHDVEISDPAYPEYSRSSFSSDVDAIIICVSTPQSKWGTCYMNNVFAVLDAAPDVPVLIKSTISINGWEMLQNAFPDRQITFSPEFLRAATAIEDFKNCKRLLMGGGNTTFWSNIFRQAMFNDVEIEISTAKELILAKYARNTFLALKVSYFNQMFDLCEELGLDYSEVRKYTVEDERIGASHTDVTDDRGYGGHCFPKDVAALITSTKHLDAELTILEAAQLYNDKLRKHKDA
jgi:UDPglucose 6-dehydrogenase